MKGLAVIPARGGSKGVPRKNIRPLAGKPLIEYSISVARSCPHINRIIVSTDDQEIADIAISAGAEVPWLRPSNLAEDCTSTMDVLSHLCARLDIDESYRPDFVLLLQPTSPFRTTEDVNASIEKFVRGDCDEVVSVVETKHHPNWCFHVRGEELIPYADKGVTRRQDLPTVYALNGAVYVYSLTRVMGIESKITRKFVVMPKERSIDIDTEFDFRLAEMLITSGLCGEIG